MIEIPEEYPIKNIRFTKPLDPPDEGLKQVDEKEFYKKSVEYWESEMKDDLIKVGICSISGPIGIAGLKYNWITHKDPALDLSIGLGYYLFLIWSAFLPFKIRDAYRSYKKYKMYSDLLENE